MNQGERGQIIETINRFMLAVDLRDGDAMCATLSEELDFDYSALGSSMPGDRATFCREVPAGMAEHFRTTQHFLSGFIVEREPDGTARTYVNYRATHWMPEDEDGAFWELAGRYTFRLVKADSAWRIQGSTIEVAWSRGNTRLTQNALKHSGI